MKTSSILTMLFIGITSLTSCKTLIGEATKNWKKEIINKETKDYRFSCYMNLSGGCQQSKTVIGKDSIIIQNVYLTDLLMLLTGKTNNTCAFVNLNDGRKDFKLDINYYPKNDAEHQLQLKKHKDTILYQLGEEMKYSINVDSMMKEVYTARIDDRAKLNSFISPFTGRVTYNTDLVRFHGDNLNTIIANLTNYVEGLIITSEINDTISYKIFLESREKEQVLKHLTQDFGLSLKKDKIEMETIEFKFEEI
jgi:hypothetical protein